MLSLYECIVRSSSVSSKEIKLIAILKAGLLPIPRHRRQNVLSNFYIIVLSFIFYLIKNHSQNSFYTLYLNIYFKEPV